MAEADEAEIEAATAEEEPRMRRSLYYYKTGWRTTGSGAQFARHEHIKDYSNDLSYQLNKTEARIASLEAQLKEAKLMLAGLMIEDKAFEAENNKARAAHGKVFRPAPVHVVNGPAPVPKARARP